MPLLINMHKQYRLGISCPNTTRAQAESQGVTGWCFVLTYTNSTVLLFPSSMQHVLKLSHTPQGTYRMALLKNIHKHYHLSISCPFTRCAQTELYTSHFYTGRSWGGDSYMHTRTILSYLDISHLHRVFTRWRFLHTCINSTALIFHICTGCSQGGAS